MLKPMACLPPLCCFLCAFPVLAAAQPIPKEELQAESAALRSLLKSSPRLPFRQTDFFVQSPGNWVLDFTSSMAIDRKGDIYLFQRGDKADPVIVANRDGRVLRSWGRGLFKIPHSIRVGPDGSIWTVDAGVSKVHKFSRDGKLLLEISIGEVPAGKAQGFRGATDIAFGPSGRLFISDGYGNARILECSRDGTRIRQWGKLGSAPGEFNLPHAIAIDREGVIYVGDRENRRVQRFRLDGKYIGEWKHTGKVFSLKIADDGQLWAGIQPADVGNGIECWLVKMDKSSGKVLGAIESDGHHSIDVNGHGEPMTGARPSRVLWFRSAN